MAGPAAFLAGLGRAAATGGAAVGRALVTSGLSTSAHSLVNPISRELNYQANRKGPDIVPELGPMLQALYTGRLVDADVQALLQYQGITWSTGDSLTQRAWRGIIESTKPIFDLDTYQRWWRQGRIDYSRAADVLGRAGFASGPDPALWLTDRETVPWQIALKLLALEMIGPAEFVAVMREHGFTQEQAQRFVQSWREVPTTGEALELWNRGAADETQVNLWLKARGLFDDKDQAAVKSLRDVIPPPQDLIRFMVREVWNPEVVEKFGFDAEFPAEFQHWMQKQGMGWEGETPSGPNGENQKLAWPLAYWRAHWYVISPAEAFQMLHRFRGDPEDESSWSVEGVPPFTMEDVSAILKIHDYPKPFRDRLAALSYSVLRLVDIRAAVRTGVRDDAWAIGKFQDRGVTADDAKFQVDLVRGQEAEKVRRRQEAHHRQQQGLMARAVLDSFQEGVIAQDAAKAGLLGLEWQEQTAALALARVQLLDQLDTVKAVVRRAKGDYMAGRANIDQVAARMAQAGLTPARVQLLQTRWQIERGENRVVISAAKVIDLLRRGLINAQQANYRLTNLGFADSDRILMMATAAQDILKAAGKAAEIAASKRKAAERELEQEQEKARRLVEHLQAIARRQTPLAQLKRDLIDGQIGKVYFRQRMLMGGYTMEQVKQLYYSVFEVDYDEPGNECGAYDPACGTATAESGTAEGEEEPEEESGTAADQESVP